MLNHLNTDPHRLIICCITDRIDSDKEASNHYIKNVYVPSSFLPYPLNPVCIEAVEHVELCSLVSWNHWLQEIWWRMQYLLG